MHEESLTHDEQQVILYELVSRIARCFSRSIFKSQTSGVIIRSGGYVYDLQVVLSVTSHISWSETLVKS